MAMQLSVSHGQVCLESPSDAAPHSSSSCAVTRTPPSLRVHNILLAPCAVTCTPRSMCGKMHGSHLVPWHQLLPPCALTCTPCAATCTSMTIISLCVYFY